MDLTDNSQSHKDCQNFILKKKKYIERLAIFFKLILVELFFCVAVWLLVLNQVVSAESGC